MRGCYLDIKALRYLDGTPLAGLTSPVGVRGRELDPFTGVPSRFPETLLCLLDVGVFPVVLTAVLRGIRLTFVDSSSKKKKHIYKNNSRFFFWFCSVEQNNNKRRFNLTLSYNDLSLLERAICNENIDRAILRFGRAFIVFTMFS